MNSYTIVGGGLAGLLIAQALLDAGVTDIRLVHSDSPLQASDAPLAICHPFPGRSLKPHPLLQDAYTATADIVAVWRSFAADCIRELPMIRPLQGANHDRLLRTFKQHWEGAVQPWLAIQLEHDSQQLRYGPCFAIKLGILRHHWLDHLMAAGVQLHSGTCENVRTDGKEITIDGVTSPCEKVILCNGPDMRRWLPNSPLLIEGGELGTFGVTSPLQHLISQAGLHAGPSSPNTVVIGSTRWETCPEEVPDAVLPSLQSRMTAVLQSPLEPKRAWRGLRSIYPVDRLPIIGEVPSRTNTYVLGALGSKGLLWGPLAARALARHMIEGTSIPPSLRASRMWTVHR